MPRIYLSPSTQTWNPYADGSGSEEYWMNLLADALEPYLYANTIARGGNINVNGVTSRGIIEVIEDLTPACDVDVRLKTPKAIREALLAPEGTPIPFSTDDQGWLHLHLDRFTCHQMIELRYAKCANTNSCAQPNEA